MSKHKLLAVMFTLVLAGLFLHSFYVQHAETESSTVTVPDDYPTIQEAINAANEGDTVFVRNGTYYERLFVNKTVELVGEDPESTFIRWNSFEEEWTVGILADNVTLRGFTVSNQWIHGYWGYGAVQVYGTGSSVFGNIITDSLYGAVIEGTNHTFTENIVYGVGRGICMSSAYTTVSRNNITSCASAGLFLWGNDLSSLVCGNIIDGCATGIWLFDNSSLTIVNNTIRDVGHALILWSARDAFIYHNNFIGYSQQLEVDNYYTISQVTWDAGYPSGGNYWSAYNGTDCYTGESQNVVGSDGIGDTPHVLNSENVDHYVLMKPYPWAEHDVGVNHVGGRIWLGGQPIIIPMKTVVGHGFDTSFLVFVMNYGTSAEAVNLTVYANSTIVGTKTDVSIEPRNSTIQEFVLHTGALGKGYYVITAIADAVLGETDISDNNLAVGLLYVGVTGDVNGDGKVSMIDLYLMALHYGGSVGFPKYVRDYDIEDDGVISMIDLYGAAIHFGQTDP